jgi:two-component system sensor kinase FixL
VVKEAVELGLVGTLQRGVHTSIELDVAVGAALLDRIQIGQVIINLVRNAVEAMEASTTRRLTVSTHATAGMVEIRVADTGPDIAPEVAERLFQPFVTSKATGLASGCRSAASLSRPMRAACRRRPAPPAARCS